MMPIDIVGGRAGGGADGHAARAVSLPRDGLDALNAVSLTGAQLRAAIDAIRPVAVHAEAAMVLHAEMLAAFARTHGLAPDSGAAALHARVAALEAWCRDFDPDGQSDIEAFFEAGARAPLIATPDGPGFEPEGFAELIAFIAELPF